MKANKNILFPVVASLVVLISVAATTTHSSLKTKNMKKNNVAGCWKVVSGYLDNHGKRIDVLGPHPSGMVVFTEDFHFVVVVHNPDIPNYASEDRAKGTPEEYKTAANNSLGVYGDYTVDENGDFLEQYVTGSTFQNLNGTKKGPDELTEKVEGNRLLENLKIADGVTMKIVYERTK
jgi:hypothetical protein